MTDDVTIYLEQTPDITVKIDGNTRFLAAYVNDLNKHNALYIGPVNNNSNKELWLVQGKTILLEFTPAPEFSVCNHEGTRCLECQKEFPDDYKKCTSAVDRLCRTDKEVP